MTFMYKALILNSHTLSNLLKCPVVVMRHSVYQVHLGTRDTADGSVPVVSDSHVQVPGVKVLKILIEGDKILQRKRKEKCHFHSSVNATGAI